MEAYAFVAESLQTACCREERCGLADDDGHVGAEELVDGVLTLAAERFGLLGTAVLRSWGLHASCDVGRVTCHLVQHGIFGKQPDDSYEDFAHGPEFSGRIRSLVTGRLDT